MSNKNIEIINDSNYNITGRRRPVKRKRTVFGTILAIVLSLFLALFLRYYVEISTNNDVPHTTELANAAVTETVVLI